MTEAKHPNVMMLDIAKLAPSPRNARTHSRSQIKKIASSIERFGFTNPILIDNENSVLAGHGRLAAAKLLALRELPCIRLDGMSDAEKRAYLIADNAIALQGGWDAEILASELQGLIDLDFDVNLTGFEQADIDRILAEATEASPAPAKPEDNHPAAGTASDAVSRRGDLWILGRHRLLCGDAKCADDVAHLMDHEKADMVFTDAPYNCRIQGHTSGRGRVEYREFVEASGEMSGPEFEAFLSKTLGNIAAVCRDGAIAYVTMDWRNLAHALSAGLQAFTELKNICVWAKTNAGMGTFYRSQHEMVLVFKAGKAAHTNNFGLGEGGRSRSNVWTYAGVNTFKPDRMAELALHPTVKPVNLVADAIRDVSHRGQIVLDVFGGSGTTLIAAEKTGRKARVIELDPAYCDVIVRRWQTLSGKSGALASSGADFESVLAARTGHWGHNPEKQVAQ